MGNRHSSRDWKSPVGSLFLTALIVALGYFFLDIWIARVVLELFPRSLLFSPHVSNIPDLLFVITSTVTVAGWAGHLYFTWKGIHNNTSRFFQLIGYTVPTSFILKSVLKYLVGRTNTRVWLLNPSLYDLHWFHGGGQHGSFPSGHMAVFTALMLGASRHYPRFHIVFLGSLFLLAVALIVTEYHFLSDVVAGGYLGYIVDHALDRRLRASSKRLVHKG